MTVLDIPLRKALQLFYAPESLRRKLLKEDIRLDLRKQVGGNRSRGGDFYQPFWSDVKIHLSGGGDLEQLTTERIASNEKLRRLYPQLRDGIIDLLNEKLRWSNEPIEIVPKSVHGTLSIKSIGGTIRIKDAIHARIRDNYTRVVYPYFSEEPLLSEEGGRLGLWAMRNGLKSLQPGDMRVIDVLRRTFFSDQTTPLQGDEEAIFFEKYQSLIRDWDKIKNE